MSKCSVENCSNPARKTGLCGKHYERKRVHGNVNICFPNKQSGKPCTVSSCAEPIISSGLCRKHYARVWRHGSTDSRLPTYGSYIHIHEQGYIMIWQPLENCYKMEHVILAEKALGKVLPESAVIHHINGKVDDNHTPFNLVICPDQSYHMLLHKRAKELGYDGV